MHYHWEQDTSLIKDVEFYAPHKEEEALIYAPPGASPEKLGEISDAMRLKGFATESDIIDDKYVLRVNKFSSRDAVLHVLEGAQAVVGTPTKEKTSLDIKEKRRLDGKQIGSLLQVAADVALIPASLSRGAAGIPDALASLKWIAAFGMLAAFGQKDPDKQTQYIFQDIRKHLTRAGFDFSAEDAANLAAHVGKEGTANAVERFIREHPVEINGAVQMSGGWSNMQGGWKQTDYKDQKNYWKLAAGNTTFWGNLVGGVLGNSFIKYPERHDVMQPDGTIVQVDKPEEHRPEGLINRFVHWVREKPLRITGSLSFASNALRIVSGLDETRKNKEYLGTDANGNRGNGTKNGLFFDERSKLENRIENFKKVYSGDNINIDDIHAAEALKEDLRHGASQIRGKKTLKPQRKEEYDELYDDSQKLLTTYDKVMRSKKAAATDYVANAVKMVGNIFIASSPSKIDADLKETGHLDEICNFMAHLVHHQPEGADREAMLDSLSGVLAGKNGVQASQAQLAQVIGSKLHALENNPWEKRRDLTVRAEPTAGRIAHVEHQGTAANEPLLQVLS